MDEYSILIKWRVFHDYFLSRKCRGIELLPTCETLRLMRRRAVVWKRTDINEWVLLGNRGTQWDEEDEMVMAVEIRDKQLWYYTENPEYLKETRTALKETRVGQEVDLNYGVKRMRWEYLLVAREKCGQRRLELAEASGRLNFEEMHAIEFMGKTVFRTTSREQVDFCEAYDYQLRLIEWKTLGKRILNKNIGFPEPGRFITSCDDCVRQVVYY